MKYIDTLDITIHDGDPCPLCKRGVLVYKTFYVDSRDKYVVPDEDKETMVTLFCGVCHSRWAIDQ